MKRALRILVAIFLLTAIILLAWLTATESGLRWTYQQAKFHLPSELTITKLQGRLIGPITANGIEYQQNGVLIKVDQTILDWRPVTLLTASANISHLHLRSLSIVLPKTENTKQPRTKPLSLPEIHLPWRVTLEDVVIDGVSVSQNNQTLDLTRVRLNATTLFSQIDIEELSIHADTFNLTIRGELRPNRNYHHELGITWQAQLPSGAVIKGNGQLEGDMDTTRIQQQLSGALQLTLNAELYNLLDKLSWQADVDVDRFNASTLVTAWPALSGKLKLKGNGDLTTAMLTGSLDGDAPELGAVNAEFEIQHLANNTIQIDHLMLDAPINKTHIDARGQWTPGTDGGDITLALHWQNLRWPLKETAWFDSAIGSGRIEGNINHYRFDLTTDRPWPQAPPSSWNANGEGNLNGLNFHSLHVTALNGEAIATGQLNWSPQFSWQAKVSATDIDPAGLWPQWPGKLNAKLTSSGHLENDQLIADTDIAQLKGKLRGYPASLRSRLSWRNNGIDIALFDFHSGDSHISAQGRVDETVKLEWAIAAPNLAHLFPEAHGQLQARGMLSGPRHTPMINASFNGKALSLPGYEVGLIDGTIAVDLFRWQQVDVRLEAQTLKLNDYSLQSLDINADTRRIELKAISEQATALIELKGEAQTKGWHGRLERADIQSSRFANWQLKTPVALNIDEKPIAIDALCWHNHQEAGICLSLEQINTAWHSHIEMNKFPLLLFSHWLPPELKLEGVTDATAELQFQAPDQLLGYARIELPPGIINYPLLEGERDRWEYRGGTAAITLDAQGVHANSEIAMSNGDLYKLKIELPGAQLLSLDHQQQSLRAEAQLTVQDLSLIEALIPEVQDLQGEVSLNLSAAGTLAQPRLSGHAHLLNGTLQIPRLGLTIDQLTLKGQSDGVEKVDFRLDAHSGDGNLAIQGETTLDGNAGWPTVLSIKGENFEVSRIPEAQVLVSPDMQVKLQKHTIDIKGDVHVPYARLQPKDITTAARVSGDSVIVGVEQPTVEKWSIVTKTRLTLGERVNFYGFGFEGRLGGSLLLEDKPGQLTKATGEITIPEGRYRAYGQRLDVEHGRLLYTGGPLTNPGLDMRAVRHVDNVTAGIKIRGSLNQPQLELFSIPAMGQSDALAYLLLGRPMENATGEEGGMMAQAALSLGLSGGDRLARILGDRFRLDDMRVESSDSGSQASLIMGRYLSPRLYVSYGVGLIEAINTLKVRYKISDKWQLITESGEYQGADILYTFER